MSADYYRQYIEVEDELGKPFTAEVRMCYDFPVIRPGGGNQVVVFDDRVSSLMCDRWSLDDMPTDTWGVLAC